MDCALDEDHDLLFSLTKRTAWQEESGEQKQFAIIRMDSVLFPDSPLPLSDYTFGVDEKPVRIAVSPEQKVLIVVFAQELRLLDYSNLASLVPISTGAGGVAPKPAISTTCPAALKSLAVAKVAKIQSGQGERTVALVLATVVDSACNPQKPQPTAFLVCDIEDPANPGFFESASSQFWQPCRVGGGPCEDWRINDFAYLRTTGPDPRDLVYIAGGRDVQIHELDITDVATTGIVDNGVTIVNSLDQLSRIHVDPDAPTSSD